VISSAADGRAVSRSARARAVLAYFRKDIRRRRSKLALGMGCAVVYALARVVEPWPLKIVFDQVLFHKSARGPWLAPFRIFGTSAYDLLAAAGLVLVLAGLVRGIAYYYEDFLLSSAAQEIVYNIRRRLYRQLHRLSVSYHQQHPTGDLLVRLSSDIILLRDVLVDAVVNLGTGVILLLLMLAVMLAVDPVLTAIAIAVVPLILVLSALYGRGIRVNSAKQRKREGQVAAVMHEALSAMDVVQLYGAGDREQERFEQLSKQSLRQGTRAIRLEARMNRGVELALAGGTVVVLWVGTLRALHGALTPGELVVFISYLRAAYRPLRRASKTVQRSAKALAAAERIAEVLAVKPELTDAPDARPAPSLEGRVAFEGVHFAYDGGEPVLDGVFLTADAGTTVGIVGATGSGKSTLVNLVPRLFDPSAGRVTIDGLDVRMLTLDSLREQISVVQQDSVLFGLSIAENIRYGHPDASDDEVRAAAQAAGLDEFLDALDTVVAEGGESLSGGQRQRVAIARALVRRPRILILDEPTSGLDTEKQLDILATFRQLKGRTTILLVTHDPALVRETDKVAILEGGRIVAEGTHTELSERSPHLRRLTGAPAARRPAVRSSFDERSLRVLFYSHNGVGVGHLQRQLDLAGAYRRRHPESAVLLVTGSHAASMFEFPDGVDFVKLPSLAMTDRYRSWEPRDLPVPLTEVVELRSELIHKTVRRFRPSLLVADFMPTGPYGELLPALEELERQGGCAVAGFRDVVDEPSFVRELWAETGVYETLRKSYAAICVYGDPSMVDFASAYGLDAELGERLRYCGYLGHAPRQTSDIPLFERPLVLVTCGGGVDGFELVEAFVHAAGRLRSSAGGTWIAVTGPLMPYSRHLEVARSAEKAGVLARRIVPELRSYTALADCIVAMPGYNTVCDVLSYRRRSVFAPRAGPSQEQLLRASRLAEWGLVDVVLPDELDCARLSTTLERSLAAPPPPPAPVPLDGIERALDVFDEVRAGVAGRSVARSRG
jgi:ATP-binding cassette, subfamily B, bacterial